MPTFGFAAFLKLASLNPKPQKTALRDRLFGEGQPYDVKRRRTGTPYRRRRGTPLALWFAVERRRSA